MQVVAPPPKVERQHPAHAVGKEPCAGVKTRRPRRSAAADDCAKMSEFSGDEGDASDMEGAAKVGGLPDEGADSDDEAWVHSARRKQLASLGGRLAAGASPGAAEPAGNPTRTPAGTGSTPGRQRLRLVRRQAGGDDAVAEGGEAESGEDEDAGDGEELGARGARQRLLAGSDDDDEDEEHEGASSDAEGRAAEAKGGRSGAKRASCSGGNSANAEGDPSSSHSLLLQGHQVRMGHIKCVSVQMLNLGMTMNDNWNSAINSAASATPSSPGL